MFSRRELLAVGAAIVAAGTAGCSGNDGGGSNPGDGGGETPTATPTATTRTPNPNCEPSIEVSGNITADQTWDCQEYVMVSDVAVGNGATLTVRPGVEVVATQGVRLTVDSGSRLLAEGTEGSPVVFRGEQDVTGFWDGIEIDTEDDRSQLTHVEVTNGGNGGYANLYVQGGSGVSIRNSTFRDSSTYGIAALREVSFSEFVENTFTGNEAGALEIGANALGSLDSASTYAGGGGPDRIEVYNETVVSDATWRATDAPIYFASDVPIDAAVTVDPGAQFTAAQGVRVSVSNQGSLSAVGRADASIRFRGDTAVTGFWDGIELLSDTPDNRLEYVEIAHGGNGGYANLYLHGGSRVSLRNSTIRDSSTHGIVGRREATLAAFAENTFTGNEAGVMEIGANALGSLDNASTYAGGAGPDRIEVYNENVVDDAAWPATDARIYFASNVPIEAAITVEPGAQCTAAQGIRLTVTRDGSLNAVGGDDTTRISFRGETPVQGYWDGIEILSLNPNNAFENCEIAHGGNGGYANIYIHSEAMATVRDSTLTDSATYGITVLRDGRLTHSGNQFSNNADGTIFEQ